MTIKPIQGQAEWFPDIGLYLDESLPPIRIITLQKHVHVSYRGFPAHDALVFYPDGLARGNGTFVCAPTNQLGKTYHVTVNHAGHTKVAAQQ